MSDVRKFQAFEVDAQGRVIVTTSRGIRVVCKPVATMLDGIDEEEHRKALAEVGVPSVPTYEVKDVSGDVSAVEYDQEAIDDPNTPDEDREAWEEYRDKLAQAEALAQQRSNDRMMRIIAVSGTEILDPEPEDEWTARHEFMGWDVPKNKYERMYHYFRREVVGTQDDGYKLIAGISAASGMSQEVLAVIEDRFRRAMGQDDAAADPGAVEEAGETEA